MLQNFSQFYEQTEADLTWQITNHNTQQLSVRPNRQGWRGFCHYQQFDNGLFLGRGNIYNARPVCEPDMNFQCHFGIHVILSASYRIEYGNHKHQVTLDKPQLWQRQGDFENVVTQWLEPKETRMVTLDFNQMLLTRWQESFAIPDWLNPRNGGTQVNNYNLPANPDFLAICNQLINQNQEALTLHEQLQIESTTLALVAKLFSINQYGQSNHKSKVDEVIDILQAEYNQPITITALAMRVGLNECYLKRDFKTYTGKTIAMYLRELRMREAMRLVCDQNYSLQEVAKYVGYRNYGHFSRLFKQAYGCTLSELRCKN